MSIKDHIRERYPNEPADLIARDLNISMAKVYRIAKSMGVKKSPEMLRAMAINLKLSEKGKAHQFKKGNKPHNTGKKVKPTVYAALEKTMFKKGNKPHNTKPESTIRINSKYNEKPYQYIKIADSDWRLLHRVIWEEHNGPIPDKHMIRFIDGNTMNCELSNLECVSMAQNMNENTIRRYPEELQELMKLNAKLNRKINGKEQNQ
jgi:hypothetical protein